MDKELVRNMRNRSVRMENEGKFWTEEDRQSLIRDYNDGITLTEMAFQYQRSESAIYQQLDRMNLFSGPVSRAPSTKEPRCLCSGCKLDPALCPCGEHCPKRMEVA